MIQEAIDIQNHFNKRKFEEQLSTLGIKRDCYNGMFYLNNIVVSNIGADLYISNRYGQNTSFNINKLDSTFYNTAIEFIRDEIHKSFSMPDKQA